MSNEDWKNRNHTMVGHKYSGWKFGVSEGGNKKPVIPINRVCWCGINHNPQDSNWRNKK